MVSSHHLHRHLKDIRRACDHALLCYASPTYQADVGCIAATGTSTEDQVSSPGGEGTESERRDLRLRCLPDAILKWQLVPAAGAEISSAHVRACHVRASWLCGRGGERTGAPFERASRRASLLTAFPPAVEPASVLHETLSMLRRSI